MLFSSRKYKSGSRWALWRWTETPSGYITRLHVVGTPFGAICLHWISTPDKEPWLHDHPVTFLSVILRGWYVEKRQTDYGRIELKIRRWFNFIRASKLDKHRIILTQKRTLTLCFMGPKRRTWGFHTDKGWVDWKTYNDEKYGSPTVKAMRHILRDYYTPADVEALAAHKNASFLVSRKDFYKKVRIGEPVYVTPITRLVFDPDPYESYEIADESST